LNDGKDFKKGGNICPYLGLLYRQRTSPWGVAAGGCNPVVKQLPLKGTGAGIAGSQEAGLG
jgi:hypothetical protein